METNVSRGHMKLRLLTTAIAVAGLAGCSLSEQSAPGLTGPSTLGRSVVLIASPDRIPYDGSSQATITATVRNAVGGTEANVALRWEAAVIAITSSGATITSIPVEPSPQVSSTGANGTATTVVRAPIAPDIMPGGQVMLRVAAIPIGDDSSQLAPGIDAKPRVVTIELVPLDGAAAPDRLPVVDFTISPPVANVNQTVTFDGSLTRDEGVVCGDRCTYLWNFGPDAATKTGRIVTLAFPSAGTRTITLFVTDERGFTNTRMQTVSIVAPAAPVAQFIVIPIQPRVNAAATFDASESTTGIGTTIVQYLWEFDDGSAPQAGKTTTHIYSAVPTLPKTAYNVTLTVTDDLGRTNRRTVAVTVVP